MTIARERAVCAMRRRYFRKIIKNKYPNKTGTKKKKERNEGKWNENRNKDMTNHKNGKRRQRREIGKKTKYFWHLTYKFNIM